MNKKNSASKPHRFFSGIGKGKSNQGSLGLDKLENPQDFEGSMAAKPTATTYDTNYPGSTVHNTDTDSESDAS